VWNPDVVDETLEAGLARGRIGSMRNPVDTDQFIPCTPVERDGVRQRLNPGGTRRWLSLSVGWIRKRNCHGRSVHSPVRTQLIDHEINGRHRTVK
jgi:hypothetical protein